MPRVIEGPARSRRGAHRNVAPGLDRTRATGGAEPRRYEIRVRGPIGPTMMQAFPTLAGTSYGQDTLLTGLLPDQSALYGVIHQLKALGRELLEIRCLPTGDAGRPARSHG
jgi:hypothetical protein